MKYNDFVLNNSVRIKEIQAVNLGGLVAFVDVTFYNKITVRKFTIHKRQGGYLVCLPREKAKNGQWHDLIEMDPALAQHTINEIQEAYEASVTDDNDGQIQMRIK